jgi:thymidylate kinase
MKIIVEGIDRLGKDTLINGLINELGYHHVIHYSSPKNYESYSKRYGNEFGAQKFQENSFIEGFKLLNGDAPDHCQNIIMNRFHLGEYVYSPMYRGYSGDYVFRIEKMFPQAMQQAVLFLLHTNNFDIMTDDGKSHDFEKREDEQNAFKEAFKQSSIKNKFKICVNLVGQYRSKENILDEALTSLKLVNPNL